MAFNPLFFEVERQNTYHYIITQFLFNLQIHLFEDVSILVVSHHPDVSPKAKAVK